MDYLIAFLLKGELKDCADRLSLELSQRFGTKDPALRCPAHITLKAPFPYYDQEQLIDCLQEFSQNAKLHQARVGSFNSFGTGVIFMDVQVPEQFKDIHQRLLNQLKSQLVISLHEFDIPGNYHVTLAKRNLKKFDQMMEYLKASPINFEVPLDSIALLKLDFAGWSVVQEFFFQP
jgi:2'-5' RNA ligase